MENSDRLVQEIRSELQLRLCDESLNRISKCVDLLDDKQIWFSPSAHINSVANQILHLNGNIRQWLLDGFFGISYVRLREKEFSARKTHTKEQLLELIVLLKSDIEELIYSINIDLLLSKKIVQIHFHVTGYGIISHVIEHASYHTGQVAQLTKWMIDGEVGFYEELDL